MIDLTGVLFHHEDIVGGQARFEIVFPLFMSLFPTHHSKALGMNAGRFVVVYHAIEQLVLCTNFVSHQA